MVHCVTQQQPLAAASSSINNQIAEEYKIVKNYPNPFNQSTNIDISLSTNSSLQIIIFNALGERVAETSKTNYTFGKQTINIKADNLLDGMYYYQIRVNDFKTLNGHMIVSN